MTAPRVAVRVPATTANLGPGYDAFGAAVAIHLSARLEARRGDGVRVLSGGEGAGELPEDDGNLLWRSFLALCTHAGAQPPDVTIRTDNAIPLERGLGSSSAAIVAGLGLARAALELEVSDVELVRLATEIEGHADNVAPAVLGGVVAVARDDAGHPVVRRAQPHPRLTPVVLVPHDRQLTTEARGVVPRELDREEVVDQAARAGHVLAALVGTWPMDARLAGDRLHEPPRLRLMGATGELVGALREAGIHAWLSGAGPSVCAAVGARDEAAFTTVRAEAEPRGFAVHRPGWDLGGLTTRSS